MKSISLLPCVLLALLFRTPTAEYLTGTAAVRPAPQGTCVAISPECTPRYPRQRRRRYPSGSISAVRHQQQHQKTRETFVYTTLPSRPPNKAHYRSTNTCQTAPSTRVTSAASRTDEHAMTETRRDPRTGRPMPPPQVPRDVDRHHWIEGANSSSKPLLGGCSTDPMKLRIGNMEVSRVINGLVQVKFSGQGLGGKTGKKTIYWAE